MTQDNRDLMRRYGDAWKSGDFAGMQALMSDDVVLHLFGHSPLAGTFKGKGDLAGIVRIIQEMTDRVLLELHDMLVGDDHAVALVRERMGRHGSSFDLERVFVYHLGGGKITEIWIYDQDQSVIDAMWS
jgi:uncharacterized protein